MELGAVVTAVEHRWFTVWEKWRHDPQFRTVGAARIATLATFPHTDPTELHVGDRRVL